MANPPAPVANPPAPVANPPAPVRPHSLAVLDKYFQMMVAENTIRIDMPVEIFNIPFPEYIGREEIGDFLHKEQIGASIITAYIK